MFAKYGTLVAGLSSMTPFSITSTDAKTCQLWYHFVGEEWQRTILVFCQTVRNIQPTQSSTYNDVIIRLFINKAEAFSRRGGS
jgi:hypothetical protein